MNYYQIDVLPSIEGDNTVTITTNSPAKTLYSFMAMNISYSIIQSSTPGFLVLDYNFNSSDILSETQIIRSGQLINIYAIADGATTLQTMLRGFITSIEYKRSIKGTFAIIRFDSVLGQLPLLNSNTSWNDVTKTYNTIMTNISGNQVNLLPFLSAIAEGSVISGIPRGANTVTTNTTIEWFTFINGQAPALPSTLWASAQVNKSRDAILREVLFPYNRILWQREDGTILIQPLFYDDKADTKWNVDLQFNDQKTWLAWEAEENSGKMINRIDFQFAAILPFDGYGGPYQGGNNIYASAFPNSVYYKRMAQLQDSGLFNTAILTNKALDPSIFTDAALYNALVQANGQSAINRISANNPVYYNPSKNNQSNSVPTIYASNEMAINDMGAYKLSVTYDFNVMTNETDIQPATKFLDLPLGKVVDIQSHGILDYDSMLCFSGVLSVNTSEGSNFTAYFTPIESITGLWYNITLA